MMASVSIGLICVGLVGMVEPRIVFGVLFALGIFFQVLWLIGAAT